MTVQERACPRCEVHRTFRLWGGRSLCANCRFKWRNPELVRRESGLNTEPAAAGFNPVELARLQTYRMAVARGVYTDWPFTDAALSVRAETHNDEREPPCPTC